jgi:hypothetical protein
MKIKHIVLYVLLVTLFSIVACKKTDESPAVDANGKGNLIIKFDNIAGNQDFALNKTYTNANNETFTVNTLWYYISNIRLKKADGTEYIHNPDSSYFLVKEEDAAAKRLSLYNIPQGDYTSVTFTIGVDSLRSTMDVSKRGGVLDVGGAGADMYWRWNSGYIFFKMEGTSPQAPADPAGNRNFYFHIGGFGGYSSKTINNLRTKTLVMSNGDKATVRGNITPEIHVLTDVLKVMNGNTKVSLAANAVTMFNDFSAKIAANYTDAFSYDHVHNEQK